MNLHGLLRLRGNRRRNTGTKFKKTEILFDELLLALMVKDLNEIPCALKIPDDITFSFRFMGRSGKDFELSD